MLKRYLKCLALCAALSAASAGASGAYAANAELPERISSSGQIVLGLSANLGFPWATTKEGTTDEFIGIEPELANEIARRLGVKLVIQNLGFDALIPSLQAKRIDFIMSGMLDTPARQNKVDFVDHIISGSAMLQTANASKTLSSVEDACGLKVSVSRGTVEAASAEKLIKDCEAAGKDAPQIQTFPDKNAQLPALSSGRSDVAFGGMEYWGEVAAKNPSQFKVVGDSFNAGPCGIAIEKGSELGPVILQTMNDMIADGTYAKLLDKYQFPAGSRVEKAVMNGTK